MSSALSQSLTIHQYHARATAGDAITQHMLFIREALEEIGIGGKIFAGEKRNLPQGKVLLWSKGLGWDCDLFLIHHSQFNPDFKSLVSLERPKAVLYHSQPSESYFSYDADLKKSLRLGKKQLVEYRKKRIPALGVSDFTAGELKDLGFVNPSLLPLMHIEAPEKRQKEWDWAEPKHFVFVGRLAPHKGQSQLIEMFFHLKKLLPPQSKLYLLGTGEPLYTKYLKLLIKQWNLENQIVLTGKVTQADLVKYYTLADAFVCASEHEGFCLPLVEAMKHGVPVFFKSQPAVKETMGKAGVEWVSGSASDCAAVLSSFIKNPKAIEGVIKKQDERLKELSLFQNKKMLQKTLFSLCLEQRKGFGTLLHTPQKSSSYETSISF